MTLRDSERLVLHRHLRTQLSLLPLPSRDRTLAHVVIESLDDDGFFRRDLEQLGDSLEMQPAVDYSEVNSALRLVQSLEPTGVAARSLQERLLLQLRQCEGVDLPLARLVLTEHKLVLEGHGVAALARELGRPVSEIDSVCRQIRRLDAWAGD